MSNAQSKLIEIIEDVEKFGGKFILFVHAATSEYAMCERGRGGLLDLGDENVRHFKEFEKKLKIYRAECAPS